MRHSITTGLAASVLLAQLLPAPAVAEAGGQANFTALSIGAVKAQNHTLIEGEKVTLGHLFSGIGKLAEQRIGDAPPPGERIVVSARQLFHIAQRFGIDWRPAQAGAATVLERAAQTVSAEAIADAVEAALSERLSGNLDINTGRIAEVVLPAGEAAEITIERLDIDRRRGRFSAAVSVSAGPRVRELRVAGRVERLVAVPVPAGRIGRGEVIGAGDIVWRERSARTLPANYLSDEQRIVGQAAKRSLNAGDPIGDTDLRAPYIVRKGETVTMVVDATGLMVTAQGRALDDGARNDLIRVMNVGSKRVVDARVDGTQRVRVATPSSLTN